MSRRIDTPESSDLVTTRELHAHITEIAGRIGRIEKLMVALAVAVASPKFGGPDPAALLSSLRSLLV